VRAQGVRLQGHRAIVEGVAQAARDVDGGTRSRPPQEHVIEENLWRAVRYGARGEMIDSTGSTEPTSEAVERLLRMDRPGRGGVGIELSFRPLETGPAAEPMHEAGASLEEVYRARRRDARDVCWSAGHS